MLTTTIIPFCNLQLIKTCNNFADLQIGHNSVYTQSIDSVCYATLINAVGPPGTYPVFPKGFIVPKSCVAIFSVNTILSALSRTLLGFPVNNLKLKKLKNNNLSEEITQEIEKIRENFYVGKRERHQEKLMEISDRIGAICGGVLSKFYPIEEITIEKMGLLMAGVELEQNQNKEAVQHVA